MKRLAPEITKAGTFGIEIRNTIKAAIILTKVATAARSTSGGTKIKEGLRAQGKDGI